MAWGFVYPVLPVMWAGRMHNGGSGVEEFLAVGIGRTGYSRVFRAELLCQPADVSACFPLGHGEVMQEAVATRGRGRARDDIGVIGHIAEGLDHQIADFSTRITAFEDEIIACEASHRPPIDDTVAPYGVIAEICRYKMLYCMYGCRGEGWLLVRGCHADIVCRDDIAADSILT